jgi:hypothetical protein
VGDERLLPRRTCVAKLVTSLAQTIGHFIALPRGLVVSGRGLVPSTSANVSEVTLDANVLTVSESVGSRHSPEPFRRGARPRS